MICFMYTVFYEYQCKGSLYVRVPLSGHGQTIALIDLERQATINRGLELTHDKSSIELHGNFTAFHTRPLQRRIPAI